MENNNQPQVTSDNYIAFFKTVYPVSAMPKDQLIDLTHYSDKTIVLIDSCGYHYKKCFPQVSTYILEGIRVCKSYQLTKDHFNRVFDDAEGRVKIPTLNINNIVLIMDQSPVIFKYQDITETKLLLEQICNATNAEIVRIRINLSTFADDRFVDRVQSLVNIVPSGYITTHLNYNVKMCDIEFQKKKHYGISVD